MKALVTGAAGFLGSHIVDRLLAAEDEVRVLVRRSSDTRYLSSLPVDIVYGDITVREAAMEATRGVDVVYHSAARVAEQGTRSDFYQANVEATRHLLDACRANGVGRFVFVSSPSVVMDGNDQIDIDETHPYPARFLNLYSETKAAAEKLVLSANGPDLVTCSIRPRAVYGPRDKSGWFPKIFAKLASGRFPDLSGGRAVHASLCYCEDAAEACVLAARSDKVGGKAYFVTDGGRTDVWQFAAQVAELFGLPPIRRKVSPRVAGAVVDALELVWRVPPLAARYPPPLSRYALSLLTRTGTYSIRAAERDLGYRPRVDARAGLARLKSWMDAHAVPS